MQRILYDLTPLDSKYYEMNIYEREYFRWWDKNDINPELTELINVLENWKFKKEYVVKITFNENEKLEKYAWKTLEFKVFLKKSRKK